MCARYSGDTRPCEALIEAGRDATIAIHEATFAVREVGVVGGRVLTSDLGRHDGSRDREAPRYH